MIASQMIAQLYTSLHKSFFVVHLLHSLVKIIRGLPGKVKQGEGKTVFLGDMGSINTEPKALFFSKVYLKPQQWNFIYYCDCIQQP